MLKPWSLPLTGIKTWRATIPSRRSPAVQQVKESGAERGGIRRYANAGRFHGFDLRLGAALPAGDDSPGMAHAPAGRGGESGYKSDGRLLCLGALQKLGGIFFCTAADLA